MNCHHECNNARGATFKILVLHSSGFAKALLILTLVHYSGPEMILGSSWYFLCIRERKRPYRLHVATRSVVAGESLSIFGR